MNVKLHKETNNFQPDFSAMLISPRNEAFTIFSMFFGLRRIFLRHLDQKWPNYKSKIKNGLTLSKHPGGHGLLMDGTRSGGRTVHTTLINHPLMRYGGRESEAGKYFSNWPISRKK